MRFVLILAAMLAAGAAGAAETTVKGAADASAPAARSTLDTKAAKSLKGLKGVTGVTTGPVALSDSDCINLQCDLKIMSSCATRVGCSCKGTGVTICVDTIDPR